MICWGCEVGLRRQIVPQSLSADNLFVMYLIFQRFKVPLKHRSRVLTWGITSAAVLRVLMVRSTGLHSQ